MANHLYMNRCLELAQRAKGYTAPNPMVGAVLVHNNRIIGEGWHQQYGQAHAEVNCLDNVTVADRHLISESTMYVNLEPCAHHGNTPPCAVRLVADKVKKVIIANVDTFEKVSGKGIEILRQNNIVVEKGILEKEGQWMNRRFFCYHQQKRPYIILKWAQTPEGYIATADKTRFQITNAPSTQLVHKWRTEEAAIMVGTNTAQHDNPQLTARLWQGKQPLRIVLDKQLRLSKSLNLFNGLAPTWVINEKKNATDGHVHYKQFVFDDTLLENILKELYAANILSLIVEGGATLLHSFINAGLWDEARIFTGNTSLPVGIAAPLIKDADLAFSSAIGNDTLHVYTNTGSAYPYVMGMKL